MAIFRKIHTSFWADTFVQDLDTDHKLFYLYLLTNERTKQCGIYEISKKQISFDTGYSIDKVSKLLNYFIKVGKIMYNDITKELAIKNWNKFNSSSSPKVVSCIKTELYNIKDRVLIEYVNGIYTASQEEQEQEEEKEQEQDSNLSLLLNKSELELTFDSYLEMRKQIKKPATPHAVNLIKKKLVQMTNNNESDMCDLLNQSIVNSWVDIYPIKNTFVKKDKPTMRTTNEVFDEISRKIKSGEIDTTIYPIL
jgi:hypothetical protein